MTSDGAGAGDGPDAHSSDSGRRGALVVAGAAVAAVIVLGVAEAALTGSVGAQAYVALGGALTAALWRCRA